ncbi:dynein light chain Tctex-type 1 isoform X1 [Chiloscyllium plagiosum]|uniref:dynein light chain Tctex-type 1 isoform X1 n=1 Tax=Chiloscyllium plagiosum TaxID=36176 RepID=UPI001CB80F70|nr:dynein light chain Tctex-type 1 isoform X1 [Chiloscyllium plagiosum]
MLTFSLLIRYIFQTDTAGMLNVLAFTFVILNKIQPTLRLGKLLLLVVFVMRHTKWILRHWAAFIVDDVSTIIKEAVENTIGGNAYQHNKVNQWTSAVVEQCLNQLTKLAKPFKYIVTCVIMQKNGAGLHTASSCFWDNSVDGSCTVRWENKTMYCIVSIFGLGV